ncbi:MAG TPA: isoprenyl transferase [Kiritimatiellia bacterium]|nr:isoprenyl transferase [Kiritimatiellia bacterium]HMO98745.1 isoprenyl transferase [Kiritimatiellia bacterium]HMP95921.1 isoprenyl transferase [Kiritimatiellia bacterium]
MSKSPPSATPRHVAIIMDGNGRWAKQRGLPRIKGHQAGADSVRAILKACRARDIEYLTLYAFSSENWVRPKPEITGLMALLKKFLREQSFELHDNQVKLRVIGHVRDLPSGVQAELRRVMDETAAYTKGTLTLALSYGGRAELTDAMRAIARRVKDGGLNPSRITEETIREHLYAPDIPDPDFMIRTSGEMRISNFLLWQLSYAELYVTPVLWPDFREPEFDAALEEYRRRHRRFGDIA